MGVNYGLGGFKDGLSYIYAAYVGSPHTITIDAVDQVTKFDTDLTPLSNYDAKLDASEKSIIRLNKQGVYLINWSATTSGASNDDISINVSNDGSNFLQVGIQNFNSKGGDLWTTSGTLLYSYSAQNSLDTLYLCVENNGSAADIVINNLQISAVRLGGLHTNSTEFIAGTAYGMIYDSGGGSLTYSVTDTFYPLGLDMENRNLLQMDAGTEELVIEQSGYYYLYGSFSVRGSSNDDLIVGVMKNGTEQTDVLKNPQQQWNSKGGAIYQTGYSAILALKAGDTIQPCIANSTDTTGATTFEYVNFVMSRIGNI